MTSHQPHGSIPGYQPGPILNGPRKAFLATVAIVPLGTYIYLRMRQTTTQREQRQLEDEGRRNWDKFEQEKARARDLSVKVARSGGGI